MPNGFASAWVSKAKLLWENPKPSEAFVSQTVPIPKNLSSNMLLVVYTPTTEIEHALNSMLIIKGIKFRLIGMAYNGFYGSRTAQYTDDGVDFGVAGNETGQQDDTKAVPLYIFSI